MSELKNNQCQCTPAVNTAEIDAIVETVGRQRSAVIPVLQAIQETYNYLPQDALVRVCEISEITPADICGVATFYSQFRHKPAGLHTIKVCVGTACHVKGAERVESAIKRYLQIDSDDDTDSSGTFTVEQVACLGCCTLAPAVQIDDVTYGHLSPTTVGGMITDFLNLQDKNRSRPEEGSGSQVADKGEIRIGLGSCCVAGGSLNVRNALDKAVNALKSPVRIKTVGCVGMCHQTPLVEVISAEGTPTLYAKVTPEQAGRIVRRHFEPQGFLPRIKAVADTALDKILSDDSWQPVTRYKIDVRDAPVSDFLGAQKHIAAEYCGNIDPLDFDEYLNHDGYKALGDVLDAKDPDAVIETISRSQLRGRGGAGFPAGFKWTVVKNSDADTKYVVMNGDEGDPGAFMDRMLLESYPYRALEGITIAAFAVGAHEGVLYIRAEYPLALHCVKNAIKTAEEKGYLGNNIMGSGFDLHLRVMEGAGAFVCGEETALLASIEGRRGMPRHRPPYPAIQGLEAKPTLINNVETYCCVPWIVRNGSDAFEKLGSESSKGTKVFSLTGKVKRGGLIEVPMGITVREIVEKIGGGVAGAHSFKAVQIGGPSGGCIPAAHADIPVDFEELTSAGAIMGSGGLVVLDDEDCMVDIARYFLKFTQEQSCGKCTYCRIGTKRMLEILDRLCEGNGKQGDIENLEHLAQVIQQGSLCGLGRTAPNPVLSTIRYFREEYEAHIQGRCPAHKCKDLVVYSISDECIGCTRCAQRCPVDAIPMTPYTLHSINTELCIGCDTCRQVCPVGAVEVKDKC